MAVMSRRKKAVANTWDAKNKQRTEFHKSHEKKEDGKVSKEDHEERLKLLKELGLVK